MSFHSLYLFSVLPVNGRDERLENFTQHRTIFWNSRLILHPRAEHSPENRQQKFQSALTLTVWQLCALPHNDHCVTSRDHVMEEADAWVDVIVSVTIS